MRLVPNDSVNDMSAGRVAHPGQLISADDMADSTWRSIVLQKQMAANTDEDKEQDAKMTLDDLALQRSGALAAEFARDLGSHSADRIVIPPTGGPGSAYGGQYSSLEASISQGKQTAMIEELRSRWDETQAEHRRELNSLKSTFVNK